MTLFCLWCLLCTCNLCLFPLLTELSAGLIWFKKKSISQLFLKIINDKTIFFSILNHKLLLFDLIQSIHISVKIFHLSSDASPGGIKILLVLWRFSKTKSSPLTLTLVVTDTVGLIMCNELKSHRWTLHTNHNIPYIYLHVKWHIKTKEQRW